MVQALEEDLLEASRFKDWVRDILDMSPTYYSVGTDEYKNVQA